MQLNVPKPKRHHSLIFPHLFLLKGFSEVWAICHTLLRANLSDTNWAWKQILFLDWTSSGPWRGAWEAPSRAAVEAYSWRGQTGPGSEERGAPVAGGAVSTSLKGLPRKVWEQGRRPQHKECQFGPQQQLGSPRAHTSFLDPLSLCSPIVSPESRLGEQPLWLSVSFLGKEMTQRE